MPIDWHWFMIKDSKCVKENKYFFRLAHTSFLVESDLIKKLRFSREVIVVSEILNEGTKLKEYLKVTELLSLFSWGKMDHNNTHMSANQRI